MQFFRLLFLTLLFAVGSTPNTAVQMRSSSNLAWAYLDLPATQSANDANLAAVRSHDREARDSQGKLLRLSVEEHLRRANIYLANRAFEEAREHWQALINYYPDDFRVAEAMLGIGRSYFQSRRYSEAYNTFDRLARIYSSTKEGREGLNFSAAALLRLGKPSEAADRYIEYVNHFPDGERIETAHLNVIDTLREAGNAREAIAWIARTRQRFAGTSTETNAIFARLRLDVAESNWSHAIATAAELGNRSFQKAVMTTPTEVAYLKAYSLDRSGAGDEAFRAYLAMPAGIDSYYGWLATERADNLAQGNQALLVNERREKIRSQIAEAAEVYPAPYRQTIIAKAKARKLDPRFVLAIIRQESLFRAAAKSQSGARGLLQLTIDAAQKYATGAGITNLRESQLYLPETSIALGSEYLGQLQVLFPSLPEAMAASYNGGEDNVARWVKRAKQKDAGVFTSEIGFEETKAYVQKVMNNYRVYRQLYNADLSRK